MYDFWHICRSCSSPMITAGGLVGYSGFSKHTTSRLHYSHMMLLKSPYAMTNADDLRTCPPEASRTSLMLSSHATHLSSPCLVPAENTHSTLTRNTKLALASRIPSHTNFPNGVPRNFITLTYSYPTPSLLKPSPTVPGTHSAPLSSPRRSQS